MDFCRPSKNYQSKEGDMPALGRLGVGEIVFLIGAVIYVVNLVIRLSGRGKQIAVDEVGLMVIGLGLALLLKR